MKFRVLSREVKDPIIFIGYLLCTFCLWKNHVYYKQGTDALW